MIFLYIYGRKLIFKQITGGLNSVFFFYPSWVHAFYKDISEKRKERSFLQIFNTGHRR